MDFAKTKKETLTDKVHDGVLEMIIQNAAPEDIVLNESRLTEVFGVSKAPVRRPWYGCAVRGFSRSSRVMGMSWSG